MHDHLYEERVSSGRTEALWIVLTLLFLVLLICRAISAGFGFLTAAFLCGFLLFLFYSLNYVTLTIRMTTEALQLRFGVFRFTMPWRTIEKCELDNTPMWRIAGAGIHCTWIRRRYRVFLNFLEHPRVVVALRERKGPARDIAFSTKEPEKVLGAINRRIGDRSTPTRSQAGLN